MPSSTRRCASPTSSSGIRFALRVEHPRRVGEHDQFLRPQRLREAACNDVGVDVVGVPVLAGPDGSDDRNEVRPHQHVDHRGVYLPDLADLADVDDLRLLPLGKVARDREAARVDEAPVLAGQAYRTPSLPVEQIDYFLVDQTAEHHLDHVHGLAVGHSHAVDEFAGLAEPVEQLPDAGSASVHDHRIHADQLHEHHVAREALLERGIGHRGAAVLQHQRPSAKPADIGKRLGEHPGGRNGALGARSHQAASEGPPPSRRASRMPRGSGSAIGKGRSRSASRMRSAFPNSHWMRASASGSSPSKRRTRAGVVLDARHETPPVRIVHPQAVDAGRNAAGQVSAPQQVVDEAVLPSFRHGNLELRGAHAAGKLRKHLDRRALVPEQDLQQTGGGRTGHRRNRTSDPRRRCGRSSRPQGVHRTP